MERRQALLLVGYFWQSPLQAETTIEAMQYICTGTNASLFVAGNTLNMMFNKSRQLRAASQPFSVRGRLVRPRRIVALD